MGGGGYSSYERSIRAEEQGFHTKSVNEIFSKRLHEGMNPKGVLLRESRDSEEHPNSVAIIIGLDQTGSMGYMPHELVKNGLPNMMTQIISSGVPDPQVMFCGIGDAHNYEVAPLQISQFESSDEKLDYWLTNLWLEGKGGGNGGEDYSLVHYFASRHTSIDCFEKRGKKGYLFTIGDDKPHTVVTSDMFKQYLGESESSAQTVEEMIAAAKEKYHVYHIHVGKDEASYSVKERWRRLLGENFIECPNYTEAPAKIAAIVSVMEASYVKKVDSEKVSLKEDPESTSESFML